MKRYMAPGNPGEFGDCVVGVVTLPCNDEAAVSTALQEINSATADMDAFLLLEDGNEATHYTLRFSSDGSLNDLIHERDFWPLAVGFEKLRPLVANYVRQVNRGGQSDSWQDEYHPRGSFAIAELALVDVSACSLLGELLCMDSSVN